MGSDRSRRRTRGRGRPGSRPAPSTEPATTTTELVVPAAELATVVHAGSYRDFDLAYGALATHVTQHAIAVDGPIREYFLVGPHDTRDETSWRTEIGWPVFHTTTA